MLISLLIAKDAESGLANGSLLFVLGFFVLIANELLFLLAPKQVSSAVSFALHRVGLV